MKEKTKPNFKKNLIISFLISIPVMALMFVLLIWRNDWALYYWVTLASDIFALTGCCYIVIYVFCLLARTTVFARFGYNAQKRQAKRNKTMPKYRTMQQYLEEREESNFDARLLWIPGASYFALAIVFILIIYQF